MSDWPAGEHLASVYDALYRTLGAGAPVVDRDAFVVRLHEASRAFGALALELRGDRVPEPDPLVSSLMDRALAEDASGALALYAVAMVIGPRLLVSLRDYDAAETDEDRRALLAHGSDVVVAEIRAVGSCVASAEAIEDPTWTRAARALVDLLDEAGLSESLGQRN